VELVDDQVYRRLGSCCYSQGYCGMEELIANAKPSNSFNSEIAARQLQYQPVERKGG
jgi:hypothetical protein